MSRIIPVILLAFLVIDNPANAGFDDDKKQHIKQIVQETIMEEPKIVVEAFQKYQTQKQEQAKKEQLLAINEYRNKPQPKDIIVNRAGEKSAKIEVFEFFDYNCYYCKKASQTIRQVLDEDSNIKFRLIEFPILSQDSIDVAKLALASSNQGKYFEYHLALMATKGKVDKAKALKVAKDIGLDVDQLKRDSTSQIISDTLDHSARTAGEINLRGTPAFIIGSELVSGAVDANIIIEKAYANNK